MYPYIYICTYTHTHTHTHTHTTTHRAEAEVVGLELPGLNPYMGDKLPENLAAFLPVQSDSSQFSDYHELFSKPVDESKLEEYFSEVQRLLEHTGDQDKKDRMVKHEKWGKVEMARQLYNEQRGVDIGMYIYNHTHTHTHTQHIHTRTEENTHTHADWRWRASFTASSVAWT